jgi:hypothetical protein
MPRISGITVKLDTKRLDAIEKGLVPLADTILKKAATDVLVGAQWRSRHRYGYMRGGWQTRPVGRLSVVVFNPVEYTIYHEFGTHKITPQPMLGPAIEQARGPFLKAWAYIFRGI